MPVAVTLDDKYVLESGRVYLTGTQALVRLPMMQRQRDLAAGLNTAGYISGYRGSPLGGFDQALWQAKRFIKNNHIEFQPGVNEDLAATALWGTQQIHLYPGARYDGVFGMWYGKGPGVDRSGDVLKHANYAGTARHGGIVALAGDDHMAKSSTTAHQSEPALIAAAIPIIHAASVQEYLDLGLHAFALSRYSGLWVAFKVLERDGRFLGLGPRRSASHRHPDPHRLRPAARRRAYPLARRLARPGAAHAHDQASRGAGLLARQQARPADDGPARRALRHRHRRQVLPRRAPGARRARHRRRRGRAPGARRLQGRHGLAARDRGRDGLRPGQARDPGGRGEAADHRAAAQGRAVQRAGRPPPRRRRQDRRARPEAPEDRRRALALRDRLGAGRPLRPRRPERSHQAAPGSPAAPQRPAGAQRIGHGARPLLLLRLPAQLLDQGARRLDGDGRHRLSHARHQHGAQHQDLHPHGRGGRDLGRRQPLHRHAARLPEPGRRHLLPFRLHGDPPRHRDQHHHHLQDPLQRRRRHDRRPAARRQRAAVDDQPAGPCRGRAPHRPGERRARQIPDRHRMGARRDASITAARSTTCSASCASGRACRS